MPIFVVEFGKKHYLCRRKKGEMQEWLNWPAWKASKPQKGFGGSNPPLSAQSSRDTALLFLLIRPADLPAFFVFDDTPM